MALNSDGFGALLLLVLPLEIRLEIIGYFLIGGSGHHMRYLSIVHHSKSHNLSETALGASSLHCQSLRYKSASISN